MTVADVREQREERPDVNEREVVDDGEARACEMRKRSESQGPKIAPELYSRQQTEL